MTEFLAAFAFFIALHSIPAVPTIRAEIIRRVGCPAYFVGYSAASILALIWVFAGGHSAMFGADPLALFG